MNIKEQVVRRLLGICECESSEPGCFMNCTDEDDTRDIRCSRDYEHTGNHFACGMEHKFLEWD